jgi:hypothetical protein
VSKHRSLQEILDRKSCQQSKLTKVLNMYRRYMESVEVSVTVSELYAKTDVTDGCAGDLKWRFQSILQTEHPIIVLILSGWVCEDFRGNANLEVLGFADQRLRHCYYYFRNNIVYLRQMSCIRSSVILMNSISLIPKYLVAIRYIFTTYSPPGNTLASFFISVLASLHASVESGDEISSCVAS